MDGQTCPAFGGVYVVKNGHSHLSKRRDLCRVVGISPSWFRRHFYATIKTGPHAIELESTPTRKREHSSTTSAGVRRVTPFCDAADQEPLELACHEVCFPPDRELLHVGCFIEN